VHSSRFRAARVGRRIKIPRHPLRRPARGCASSPVRAAALRRQPGRRNGTRAARPTRAPTPHPTCATASQIQVPLDRRSSRTNAMKSPSDPTERAADRIRGTMASWRRSATRSRSRRARSETRPLDGAQAGRAGTPGFCEPDRAGRSCRCPLLRHRTDSSPAS